MANSHSLYSYISNNVYGTGRREGRGNGSGSLNLPLRNPVYTLLLKDVALFDTDYSYTAAMLCFSPLNLDWYGNERTGCTQHT